MRCILNTPSQVEGIKQFLQLERILLFLLKSPESMSIDIEVHIIVGREATWMMNSEVVVNVLEDLPGLI